MEYIIECGGDGCAIIIITNNHKNERLDVRNRYILSCRICIKTKSFGEIKIINTLKINFQLGEVHTVWKDKTQTQVTISQRNVRKIARAFDVHLINTKWTYNEFLRVHFSLYGSDIIFTTTHLMDSKKQLRRFTVYLTKIAHLMCIKCPLNVRIL